MITHTHRKRSGCPFHHGGAFAGRQATRKLDQLDDSPLFPLPKLRRLAEEELPQDVVLAGQQATRKLAQIMDRSQPPLPAELHPLAQAAKELPKIIRDSMSPRSKVETIIDNALGNITMGDIPDQHLEEVSVILTRLMEAWIKCMDEAPDTLYNPLKKFLDGVQTRLNTKHDITESDLFLSGHDTFSNNMRPANEGAAKTRDTEPAYPIFGTPEEINFHNVFNDIQLCIEQVVPVINDLHSAIEEENFDLAESKLYALASILRDVTDLFGTVQFDQKAIWLAIIAEFTTTGLNETVIRSLSAGVDVYHFQLLDALICRERKGDFAKHQDETRSFKTKPEQDLYTKATQLGQDINRLTNHTGITNAVEVLRNAMGFFYEAHRQKTSAIIDIATSMNRQTTAGNSFTAEKYDALCTEAIKSRNAGGPLQAKVHVTPPEADGSLHTVRFALPGDYRTIVKANDYICVEIGGNSRHYSICDIQYKGGQTELTCLIKKHPKGAVSPKLLSSDKYDIRILPNHNHAPFAEGKPHVFIVQGSGLGGMLHDIRKAIEQRSEGSPVVILFAGKSQEDLPEELHRYLDNQEEHVHVFLGLPGDLRLNPEDAAISEAVSDCLAQDGHLHACGSEHFVEEMLNGLDIDQDTLAQDQRLHVNSFTPIPPPDLRTISYAEFVKHNNTKSCWVIIDNIVCNLTSFLNDHPGKPDIILQYAGQDATRAFHRAPHGGIEHMTRQYAVGRIADASPSKEDEKALARNQLLGTLRTWKNVVSTDTYKDHAYMLRTYSKIMMSVVESAKRLKDHPSFDEIIDPRNSRNKNLEWLNDSGDIMSLEELKKIIQDNEKILMSALTNP